MPHPLSLASLGVTRLPSNSQYRPQASLSLMSLPRGKGTGWHFNYASNYFPGEMSPDFSVDALGSGSGSHQESSHTGTPAGEMTCQAFSRERARWASSLLREDENPPPHVGAGMGGDEASATEPGGKTDRGLEISDLLTPYGLSLEKGRPRA